LTLPSTSGSSPKRTRSISTSTICSCDGSGALAERLERAQTEQLAVLESYEFAGRTLALVPCNCPAGQSRVERWRGLPEEARGMRLQNGRARYVAEQARAVTAVKAFIKQPHGWLTLAGGYGVGKTALIYAALNHLSDRGIHGRYLMMPELLDDLRTALRRDDQTYAAKLRRVVIAPVLAIDELDKMRDSEFVDEVLHAIFLHRYQQRNQLGTLIGYNLDGAAHIPAFLQSRIRDSRFQLVQMEGPDLRPQANELDPWDRGEGE
jgi:DNA replication protein DnaC